MIARGMRYAEASSRVRARLGGLLTARDYASMIRTAGPEQMLAELRSTRYARTVELAAAATTSFADALHQEYFASAERIADLLPPSARHLCHTFLVRLPIESLKVILRTAGNTPDRPRLSRLLGPLVDSDLPIERLIDAATIHDVVEALSQTAYAEPLRAVIRRASPDHGSTSALLFHMELALDRWFFERVWLACRSMPRADSRLARRLIGTFADVSNILWARRLRETFRLSPADVAPHLIPYGFHLTDRQRRALGSEATDRPLPFPLAGVSRETADLRVRLLRLLRREASRPLFMAPFQVGLPLAYLLLAEMEMSDLIALYEGKRWSVPPQTLAEHMIRFAPEALTEGH